MRTAVIRLAPVLKGQQDFGGKSEFYDLAALADATRLADWMYSQFAACVHGDVCEIGPGIGTFSQRILDAGAGSLHLVEPSDEACDHLRGRFGSDDRVSVVSELLPGAPSMQQPDRFDFVLAQNVLEHIEDDGGAAAEVAGTLRPAGRFGVLVPAHPRLYSALDTAYGHYRRYTREHLPQHPRGRRPAGARAALVQPAGHRRLVGQEGGPLHPAGHALAERLRAAGARLAAGRGPGVAAVGPEPDRDRGEAGMSADAPELTIIVPVYNERERVREAMDQIAGVELPLEDFELVVVDDGSTDGTAATWPEGTWPGHVRFIAHPRTAARAPRSARRCEARGR